MSSAMRASDNRLWNGPPPWQLPKTALKDLRKNGKKMAPILTCPDADAWAPALLQPIICRENTAVGDMEALIRGNLGVAHIARCPPMNILPALHHLLLLVTAR